MQPSFILKKNIINCIAIVFILHNSVYAGAFHKRRSLGTGELVEILSEYARNIDNESRKHPIRFAVLPFTSSVQTPSDPNSFGNYISEKLLNYLPASSDKIKLFERNRLDALFKEYQLELSGLLSEAQALKIGELAPIDFILTGTYAVLKTSVSITGRLIDVTTGEIVFSTTNECAIGKEFKDLLPQETVQQQETGSAQFQNSVQSMCAKEVREFKQKVNALAAEKQFSFLITEGIRHPFDTICPEIHLSIIKKCTQTHQNPSLYSEFLIQTLASLRDPENDLRTDQIFNYFRADKLIDSEEWNAGIKVLSKIKRVERYFPRLIIADSLTDEFESRLSSLVRLCNQGKVGVPPVPFDILFYESLRSLGITNQSNYTNRGNYDILSRQAHVLLHLLKKHTKNLTDTISYRFADILDDYWRSLRYTETSDSLQAQLFSMINRSDLKKSSSEIRSIASTLISDLFEKDTVSLQYHTKASKAAHEFVFFCKKILLSLASEMNQQEARNSPLPALFLFTNTKSSITPSIDSLSFWISSEDKYLRQKSVNYVVYMDKHAILLEKKLIRVLRQRVQGIKSNDYENNRIVRALGQSRTRNPEAHQLLILCLDSLNHRFSSGDVVRALYTIGTPVIPLVKIFFEKDIDSHVFYTAAFFEHLGASATEEIPYLEKWAFRAGNLKTKYRIEDAVERIKKNK